MTNILSHDDSKHGNIMEFLLFLLHLTHIISFSDLDPKKSTPPQKKNGGAPLEFWASKFNVWFLEEIFTKIDAMYRQCWPL